MDIVKTTITFNPKVENELLLLSKLYDKGKFSTNIKNRLIESYLNQRKGEEKEKYQEMETERLVGVLAMLLFEIDGRGIDVSKIVRNYCGIEQINFSRTEQVQNNTMKKVTMNEIVEKPQIKNKNDDFDGTEFRSQDSEEEKLEID